MRIGIAVDGSSPARAGVELVASLPLRASDQVFAVAVAEPHTTLAAMPFGHASVVASYVELALEAAEEHARMVVGHAVERLVGLACPVTPVVRVGHTIEVLRGVVEELDLDLLVLGPRGRGSLGSFLLGSVSQGLLHAMPTSVLIARPPVGMLDRVILATDGSPSSLAAARYLSDFPLPAELDLRVLVSVTDWSGAYRDIEAPDYLTLREAERERALSIAREAITVLESSGRAPQPLVRDGDPKREIIDAARELDASLVVTGSRGHGGFAGLVLGSVSRGVSMAAPCSVLVVGDPKVATA